MDGLSCELTYRDGALSLGLTRGDGYIGVDITDVVTQIPSIPKRLPELRSCIVRGEIIMRKESLAEINVLLLEEDRPPFANTRNGTVAVIKAAKNHKFGMYLDFRAFDLMLF